VRRRIKGNTYSFPRRQWLHERASVTSLYVHRQSCKIIPQSTPTSAKQIEVRNYHCSLRDNPEERRSQLLRGGRLKSSLRSSLFLESLSPSEFYTYFCRYSNIVALIFPKEKPCMKCTSAYSLFVDVLGISTTPPYSSTTESGQARTPSS